MGSVDMTADVGR